MLHKRTDSGPAVWRRNGGAVPLHIPKEGHYVFNSPHANGLGYLKTELERLSVLGSTWASCALGWLCICRSRDGKRNPDRAIELCKNPAAAGDAYANYVLAWALMLTNQGTEALNSMKSAALAGFLPARLELVTFVWNGHDPTGRNRSVAYDLLKHADGHKAAMIWRCRLNRSGEFGWIRWLLGHLLAPIAFLRYAVAFWTNPLSSNVLVFQSWMTRPREFDVFADNE
jgi:hypothetical protein